MERQAVMDIVLKHLRANVDELEDARIDPTKSMLDMGATSLDLVEIVSAAMRELKIRVPRTRLASLKNVDELVDLFHAVKNGEPSTS